MGDAGNKWIGCESSDFMLGCFWMSVGVKGGYMAFVVMTDRL